VVFSSPADGIRLVKRVVGLPGDRIELRDDELWINGEPAAYEPLDPAIVQQIEPKEQPQHEFAAEQIAGQAHPVMTTPGSFGAPRFFGPVTVPPDHYFMMGDNRDNSRDSRSIGFVPKSSIVGRATAVAISLDPEHSYAPRWGRFFRALD
jgi:signal peptidase I